jgi:transglutaminase-like putative cysteine protease
MAAGQRASRELSGAGTLSGIVHDDVDGLAVAQAIAVFEEVRGFPYAIDAAHDAETLVRLRAGDCLAKSDLLARGLRRLGIEVRMVRWLYLLPDVVPEARELPERLDMHRAVEVWTQHGWTLVDATHDPALAGAGLTVGTWDGSSSTQGAYPPVGPLRVEGRDSDEIAGDLSRVRRWIDACPPAALTRWRQAYIRWLDEARGRSGDGGC